MADKSADLSRPIAEISQGPSAFDSFMDRNQKGLMALGVVIALATGSWVVYRGIKHGAATTAAGELAAAEGLPALQEVVKAHPDTPAGGSAQILIAEEQWKANQQDAAIETLRQFLNEHPEHPAVPSARASLGSRLMQQGKNAEAATLLQQVANDPKAKYLAGYALTLLGDLAKLDGKLDDAENFYKQAKERSGATNPFVNLASQHLELLRFKMPTEVDAPPAPPAAPDAPEAGLPPEMRDNPLIENFAPPAGVTPPEEAPADPAPPAPPVIPPAPPTEEGKSN